MALETEYTVDEVAQHTKPDDIWMTIHGEVYDVTKYVMDHPGGIEVLLEAAGTDASDPFDNAGHSDDAFDLMTPFRIGKLKGHVNKKSKLTIPLQPSLEKLDSTKQSHGLAGITLGFLSLGIAASTYKILKGEHALAIRKSFGIIMGEANFRTYPNHLKVPKSVTRDPLLQRGWLDSVLSPLPLTKKILIAPNVYRLVFSLPQSEAMLGLPTGQHVAITMNVDGEKVTRSYTPVSNNLDYGVLELLVKIYPDGKLTGGCLANLQIGDEVHFRGPKGAMRYSNGLCKKIGMIAGGTGITPMFQLIRAICENDRDATEISLIYANHTENDILLKDELDKFSRLYPKLFNVFYVIEHPSATWNSGVGYITKDIAAQRLPLPGNDVKIMVCGPPGMVGAAKKFLGELGYETPGVNPKMSDQVFIF
ncbi:cytochrome-b5 reductase [Trichoderma harzianum]|uniref:Cytochrome-b5 reductase n=1 Tax=Trichoderma harzianum TaxID=5544 RepID=A0A0F9WXC6_TRIHA|nr:cytochrome-b5 reductase [Trichoderma harzianum]